jgi:regulator of protease activity HflC (stomatin/prohibitin superfamily)
MGAWIGAIAMIVGLIVAMSRLAARRRTGNGRVYRFGRAAAER